jgi:hypothetical protein
LISVQYRLADIAAFNHAGLFQRQNVISSTFNLSSEDNLASTVALVSDTNPRFGAVQRHLASLSPLWKPPERAFCPVAATAVLPMPLPIPRPTRFLGCLELAAGDLVQTHLCLALHQVVHLVDHAAHRAIFQFNRMVDAPQPKPAHRCAVAFTVPTTPRTSVTLSVFSRLLFAASFRP